MMWPPPDPKEVSDGNPKIQCSLHDDYCVIAACETCDDRLVCIQCMNSSCFGHTLCNLEEVAERRKQNISCLLRDAEVLAIPKLEVHLNQVRRKRVLLSTHCDDVSRNIRKQAQELKRSVDTICEKLVEECAVFQKRKDDILKTFEDNISKDHAELLDSISKVKNIISSCKLQDILLHEDVISVLSKPQSKTCVPVVAAVWFTPTDVDMVKLNRLFGTMQRSVPISEFEHIPSEVRSICIVGEQAWITCDGNKELYLTNKEGDCVRSIKVYTYSMNQIMDICLGADDSVWVARRDGIMTQLMPHDVREDRFFIGVNATAYSLYVFNDGDIVIGLVEGVFRMRGKLVRYSPKGEVLDRAVRDNDGNLLFSTPNKVRGCDESREIAVVNLDNKGHHSVVILDADMKFKLNFKGKTPFHPSDVCFDSGQNILISDRASMSVMLLDSHGRMCRNLLVTTLAPSAIRIQGNGDLWTGFENGMVRVYKYAP
ncbi:uncharacterized protein LOC110450342 [Mizuhopecten yessoensis]|uniref:Tripartite motif-containing protein 2 n=1 Tax=Mizuhopecten yessoensis TaxID=6573 RepID=A0A210QP10_MIZYE|nr:uncharacterized protein LOC110450342 [Mizuhopecten yessoensis]OWF50469.1 hypothetical protein KP79_PYT22418 [Mizuhopecten yessoensis]